MPKQLPGLERQARDMGRSSTWSITAEGAARMMQGDRFFREVMANCWDPEVRIEEYAKSGVQVQVVCTIPVLFAYWAKARGHSLDIARYLNDDQVRTRSCRTTQSPMYLGLATLPMQDVDLSIQELERGARSSGFAGIQIGSNINGYNLSEPRFDPICGPPVNGWAWP